MEGEKHELIFVKVIKWSNRQNNCEAHKLYGYPYTGFETHYPKILMMGGILRHAGLWDRESNLVFEISSRFDEPPSRDD